jgi:methylated-DNA-[protein]-cysteine S-methyltransferase
MRNDTNTCASTDYGSAFPLGYAPAPRGRRAVHLCPALPPARLRLDRMPTPLGTALLVTDADGVLRALDFQDCESRMRRLLRSHYGHLPLRQGAAPTQLTSTLREYFAGQLHALRAIAWATAGSPFQRAVWHALVDIPAGQTRSYGELAQALGLPEGARAVGWANASNPIAIVVPCHRVIGASGKLTGYAGGLPRKRWLLTHEGARCAENANRELFGS